VASGPARLPQTSAWKNIARSRSTRIDRASIFQGGPRNIFEKLNSGHRSDIDGLRALAVVPVVLFHAGVPGNSGGFLGVDVFFVISGFLITSILLREIDEDRFSIVGFYNRRVRRIFPALFAVLLAVCIAALFLLSPAALARFGWSVLGTTFFVSNILFYREAGYFDTSSLEKPLLHTWSLAVEEQFYLVWPLLLWALVRFGGRRMLMPMVLLGVAGSFALAVVASIIEPTAAFFLPVTRAWELGLGAIIAIFPPLVCSKRVREIGGIVGLGSVIAAIALFDEKTPMFLASGVASAGAAILIAFNRERTWVGRLLSIRLFVAIGLISYSLYLWHWPLFAFAHYYFSGQPPAVVMAMLIVAAVGLSTLSWFAIEQPLRRGKPRPAFIASAIAMAVFAIGGLVLTSGLPKRFPPEVAALERAAAQPTPFCMGCSIGVKGSPGIVLWGDSHAATVSPAIRHLSSESGVPAVAFTRSACPPLIGATPTESGKCEQFQEEAFARIAELADVQLIVLVGRWTMSTETTRFGEEQGRRYFLRDAQSRGNSVADSRRAFREALPRTVEALRRAHPEATILLIGQSPEPGFDAAQCLIRSAMFDRSSEQCRWAWPGSLTRLRVSDDAIRALAGLDHVDAIYLSEQLCDKGRCPTVHGNLPLYSDVEHLSPGGAVLLLDEPLRALSLRPAPR
jgi:peptidoglycan/LPS O-acetylase OafA/YrhL